MLQKDGEIYVPKTRQSGIPFLTKNLIRDADEDADGDVPDAAVADDDDEEEGLDAFDVAVGGVENVTLCVDGEVGGCSRCWCCCGGRW